jgi:Pyruvate/2-oxoacid:ferredoxin oxidoreductase delta subunit
MNPLAVFLIVICGTALLIGFLIGLLLMVPKTRNGIHAYIYGRWTDKYVSFLRNIWVPRFGTWGKYWLAERYHGKVLTPDQANAIVTLDHDISEQEVEQIIPYKHARKIVLNGPPDIAAYECACRASRPNPCQPTQVCMVVGQPYVDATLKHHPGKSRRLSRDEALAMLKAEHERGHLHSAWFKDAMGDRFYVICNCCKCCCGGIEAMTKYKSPIMISSGYTALIDNETCLKCGTCAKACPFEAIAKNDEGIFVVDEEICMGCAVCQTNCSNSAINLKRDEKKPVPLDVRLLS